MIHQNDDVNLLTLIDVMWQKRFLQPKNPAGDFLILLRVTKHEHDLFDRVFNMLSLAEIASQSADLVDDYMPPDDWELRDTDDKQLLFWYASQFLGRLLYIEQSFKKKKMPTSFPWPEVKRLLPIALCFLIVEYLIQKEYIHPGIECRNDSSFNKPWDSKTLQQVYRKSSEFHEEFTLEPLIAWMNAHPAKNRAQISSKSKPR